VDATSDITTADLALGEVGRDLWEPALPHLTRLFSGDATAYLDAFESAACGAGLTQEVPVKTLLDAYSEGAARVRARIVAGDDADAETAARRLLAVEHVALTRIAAGYSGGLGETIERLRRAAAEASPVDDDTGAIKPDELDERLSLEVERCKRMDLSLGLLELALDEGGDEPAPSATVGRGAVALHEIGGCLRENLRRYDSVGLTQDGAFLLVLPDISRRGLAGAAERLRRELGGCAGRGRPPDFTFALAHYDFVDVNANEMLTGLTRSMQEALSSHRPLAWV
jgi:GGDEF domain-containing protein